MNDLKRSFCFRLLLGFVLGLMAGGGFILLWRTPDVFWGMTGYRAVTAYLIYCGVFGAASIGGTILYEIDDNNPFRATAIHFVIILGGLFLLFLSLGMRLDSIGLWVFISVCIAVFCMIWLIIWFHDKRRIQKMNEDLQKWKELHHKPGTGYKSD